MLTEEEKKFKRIEAIGDGIVSVCASILIFKYSLGKCGHGQHLRALLCSNKTLKKFAIKRNLKIHPNDPSAKKKRLADAYEYKLGTLCLNKTFKTAFNYCIKDMLKFLKENYII